MLPIVSPLKRVRFYGHGLRPMVSLEDLRSEVGKADLPSVYIKLAKVVELKDPAPYPALLINEEGAMEYLRLANCSQVAVNNMKNAFYTIKTKFLNAAIANRLGVPRMKAIAELGYLGKWSADVHTMYGNSTYDTFTLHKIIDQTDVD